MDTFTANSTSCLQTTSKSSYNNYNINYHGCACAKGTMIGRVSVVVVVLVNTNNIVKSRDVDVGTCASSYRNISIMIMLN